MDPALLHAESRNRIQTFVRQHVTSSDFDCEIHHENRGRVYEAIGHHARELDADLVVIGRSVRPKVIPGSLLLTTGRVIANAYSPVLVVSRPVSGNYVHIVVEADLSSSPERTLTPVRDFGPDIRLTLLSRARAKPDGHASVVQRFQASLHRRRRERFESRAGDLLRQRGLSADRISIEMVAHDYDETLLSKLNDKEIDVVALRSLRQKLRDPDPAIPLLAELQRASCDVLAIAGA